VPQCLSRRAARWSVIPGSHCPGSRDRRPARHPRVRSTHSRSPRWPNRRGNRGCHCGVAGSGRWLPAAASPLDGPRRDCRLSSADL